MADFPVVVLDTVTPELQSIPTGDRGVVEGSILVEETLEVPNGGIILKRIAGSTFFSVQTMQNQFHSTGSVTGGTINDATSGDITVDAGTGFIRATDSPTAELLFFDWSALSTTSIPVDTTRFVGVEYNGGSPQVVIRTSENWDLNTEFPLGVVINEGDVLHIDQLAHQVGDHARGMIDRLHQVAGTQRDNSLGGLMLGETGTRNVTMSSGAIWQKLVRTVMSNINTSGADTFDIYYRDGGGGFTRVAAQAQWPNAQYDDGTGTLNTLTNNRYATIWFWLENDNDLIAMYGQVEHSSASAAEAESIPSLTPDRIKETALLIGQIIFQKSAGTAEEIRTVFSTTFSAGSALENHTHIVTDVTDLDVDLSTFALPADTTISGFGASLIGEATANDARTTLGLEIDTDVQAFDADTAKIDVVQTFTATQRGGVTVLTSSGNSIAIDLDDTNNYSHTLTENTTLAAPSNPVAGQSGVLTLTQHASSPKTLAYNAFWKFAGGTIPDLTATNSAIDTFAYYIISATQATCQLIGDVK